jgi:iron(III) transport system ATP-binding protein
MSGVRLDDVFHAYGAVEVVRGVSLAVTPGQVACLLGPSGCGKTTLLRLAAGLEAVRRGRVTIGDRVVADGARGLHVAPERRRVGLMFQDYALFPHLTVFDNIAFGISNLSVGRRRWVRSALERMGLAAFARSYPHTLSGGQQQRCALLRALAPNPDVLLLDEPFSGLDVTRRAQVREQTLELLRETGIATLIVSHDPEEAMFMSDRLLIMEEGEILQHGAPAEIYLHPRDASVAELFGPLNHVPGVVADGHLRTPVGAFDAHALADGARAPLLIRPEGLTVAPPGAGTPATVTSARLLGRSSHLRVTVDGVEEPLAVLVPGVYLPEPGTAVSLKADPAQAFVFATR